MQVIITSYCRLKYLRQTVESLRQDDIQLFIADGGSDDETKEYIKSAADGWLFFENNPGADVLKTAGIKEFVTEREFLISSDDLRYPAGYSRLITEQYRKINPANKKPEWTFVACNMPMIEENHLDSPAWKMVNGVQLLPVATSQVAGAILDLEACKSVGYFPVYGRSGQGDWAISKRLREVGYHLAYWRAPIIGHIGQDKWHDFPEYSAAFKNDEDSWIESAMWDKLKGKV